MKTYYLGTHRDLLDPISLRYLCFGALWFEERGQRYIVGYGFGKNKNEILHQFSAYASYQVCTDIDIVHGIYKEIRKKQQEQDWSKRSRLPLLAAFRKPWSGIPQGWYVLKSQKSFPTLLSFVHKTKFAVYLVHSTVCESEMEIQNYIDKVNAIHHVDLKWVEGWSGKQNGKQQ